MGVISDSGGLYVPKRMAKLAKLLPGCEEVARCEEGLHLFLPIFYFLKLLIEIDLSICKPANLELLYKLHSKTTRVP